MAFPGVWRMPAIHMQLGFHGTVAFLDPWSSRWPWFKRETSALVHVRISLSYKQQHRGHPTMKFTVAALLSLGALPSALAQTPVAHGTVGLGVLMWTPLCAHMCRNSI